jgi:hypothetical protein
MKNLRRDFDSFGEKCGEVCPPQEQPVGMKKLPQGEYSSFGNSYAEDTRHTATPVGEIKVSMNNLSRNDFDSFGNQGSSSFSPLLSGSPDNYTSNASHTSEQKVSMKKLPKGEYDSFASDCGQVHAPTLDDPWVMVLKEDMSDLSGIALGPRGDVNHPTVESSSWLSRNSAIGAAESYSGNLSGFSALSIEGSAKKSSFMKGLFKTGSNESAPFEVPGYSDSDMAMLPDGRSLSPHESVSMNVESSFQQPTDDSNAINLPLEGTESEKGIGNAFVAPPPGNRPPESPPIVFDEVCVLRH